MSQRRRVVPARSIRSSNRSHPASSRLFSVTPCLRGSTPHFLPTGVPGEVILVSLAELGPRRCRRDSTVPRGVQHDGHLLVAHAFQFPARSPAGVRARAPGASGRGRGGRRCRRRAGGGWPGRRGRGRHGRRRIAASTPPRRRSRRSMPARLTRMRTSQVRTADSPRNVEVTRGERLLHEVLGVGRMPAERVGDAAEVACVAVDELLERGARSRRGPLHQLRVVVTAKPSSPDADDAAIRPYCCRWVPLSSMARGISAGTNATPALPTPFRTSG